MSSFIRAAGFGALLLLGVLVLVVEGVCWIKGPHWRYPLYWGGAAGFLVNLLGFPFMLKLAVLTPEKVRAGEAWNWWLASTLARMSGIGALMLALRGKFQGQQQGVTLMAIVVYMAGMFTELAWIGRRFNSMDKK